MRISLKPAAAAAAAAFLLLLLLHLTWPGPGLWTLIIGLLVGAASAALWWRDRVESSQSARSATRSPLSDVGPYGLSNFNGPTAATRVDRAGVALSTLLAPVAALAILLFIAGSLGAAEPVTDESVVQLESDVTAIDRSGDVNATQGAQTVNPPTTQPTQRFTTATVTTEPRAIAADSASQETESNQPATTVKPIVVAAPQVASAADEDEADAVSTPAAAATFEYVIEEGDTLYEIAEQHGTTVDALLNLNDLDGYSFIHPGDVILIPLEESEES